MCRYGSLVNINPSGSVDSKGCKAVERHSFMALSDIRNSLSFVNICCQVSYSVVFLMLFTSCSDLSFLKLFLQDRVVIDMTFGYQCNKAISKLFKCKNIIKH